MEIDGSLNGKIHGTFSGYDAHISLSALAVMACAPIPAAAHDLELAKTVQSS